MGVLNLQGQQKGRHRRPYPTFKKQPLDSFFDEECILLQKFSNLLGTVYRRGNLTFSPDGNTLFSPVGNKISAFDLKTHKSETLNIEGTECD